MSREHSRARGSPHSQGQSRGDEGQWLLPESKAPKSKVLPEAPLCQPLPGTSTSSWALGQHMPRLHPGQSPRRQLVSQKRAWRVCGWLGFLPQ